MKEEIEKQAEEIANERCRELMCYGRCNIRKNHHCGYWHYNYECALKGIEYGLAEGRKENNENIKKIQEFRKIDQKQILEQMDTIADLEKDKCELLGLIQGKDQVIAELKYNLKCRDDELAESKAEIKQIIERERVVPEHYLCEMIDKNKELKAQVEKMKCCGNCKHFYKDCTKEKDCKQNKYKHWELPE